jgi:hypothetical protein
MRLLTKQNLIAPPDRPEPCLRPRMYEDESVLDTDDAESEIEDEETELNPDWYPPEMQRAFPKKQMRVKRCGK